MPRNDVPLLFTTRIIRLFAYGFLSVALALYLAQVGLSEPEIGLLLTLTLVGDVPVTLWITTSADRIGRRRMLLLGAGLMVLAGLVFAFTHSFVLLVVTAIIGVISPSGNDIGPFLSIEQAGLTQIIPSRDRTKVFAWYNLVGSFATALGSLASGGLVQALQGSGMPVINSYQVVLVGYALFGIVLAALFAFLSPQVEVGVVSAATIRTRLGLHKSQKVVLRLSALFALDAFAGGFVVQSIMAFWFHEKFGVEPAVLGSIFFGANILAGISALLAARIAAKIGLINTMVFTHVPSNILLMLVPLMPTLPLAIIVLLLRFSISQMDVPTRQSYTMAVVEPDERSSASGITGIARTIGASIAPVLSTSMLANPMLGLPFIASGAIKLIYDFALYRSFQSIKPPEEHKSS